MNDFKALTPVYERMENSTLHLHQLNYTEQFKLN